MQLIIEYIFKIDDRYHAKYQHVNDVEISSFIIFHVLKQRFPRC